MFDQSSIMIQSLNAENLVKLSDPSHHKSVPLLRLLHSNTGGALQQHHHHHHHHHIHHHLQHFDDHCQQHNHHHQSGETVPIGSLQLKIVEYFLADNPLQYPCIHCQIIFTDTSAQRHKSVQFTEQLHPKKDTKRGKSQRVGVHTVDDH